MLFVVSICYFSHYVTKILEESNLKEEGFPLVHSVRVQSIMVGKTRQQELRELVTLYPQSGSREVNAVLS